LVDMTITVMVYFVQDIAELRAELERKNALIQKHSERLQHWQAMLNRSPSAPAMGGSPTGPPAAASNPPAMPPAVMGIPQPGAFPADASSTSRRADDAGKFPGTTCFSRTDDVEHW